MSKGHDRTVKLTRKQYETELKLLQKGTLPRVSA